MKDPAILQNVLVNVSKNQGLHLPCDRGRTRSCGFRKHPAKQWPGWWVVFLPSPCRQCRHLPELNCSIKNLPNASLPTLAIICVEQPSFEAIARTFAGAPPGCPSRIRVFSTSSETKSIRHSPTAAISISGLVKVSSIGFSLVKSQFTGISRGVRMAFLNHSGALS